MNKSLINAFFAIYLPVIFWLMVLIYLAITKNNFTLVFVGLGGIMLRAVCEIIYFFYKKPRPYQTLGVVPPSSIFFGSPLETRFVSFPSAHSAVMFFGAFFLIYDHFYVLGALAVLVAILTSYARVKLLYHYFVDILGGLALAGFWLIIMAFVARM